MNAIEHLVGQVRRQLQNDASAQKALDEVLKQPPVLKFMQSAEDRAHAHRVALVADLANVPAKLEAQAIVAGRAANAAAVALEAARAEVVRLTDAHRDAEMAALGAGTQIDVEVARLTGELLAGADPRLARLIGDMRDFVHGPLLRGITDVSRKKANFWNGQTVAVQHTNTEQVKAIEASARKLIEQAQAAQLQALKRDEVTALIRGWLDALEREMKGVGIKFLALDEHGDITHPNGRGQPLADSLEGRIKGLKLKEAA